MSLLYGEDFSASFGRWYGRWKLKITMRTRFLDYDVVKAARSLEENIPKGTLGAVLMVLESENSRYEVEFIDCDGDIA